MRILLRLLGATARAQMQYKLNFVLSTLLYALITAADFLTVATILYRYPTVAGWRVWEIALLSGIISTSYGLYRSLAAELNNFERYLVTGEFDILMIRPWPTLGTLLVRGFDFGRAGASLQGIALMALGLRWAIANGAPVWLPIYVYLLPLAGAMVIAALNLVTAAAGFWLTRIDELTILVTNAPQTAAQYPLSIYPAWLQRIWLGVLPVGTVAYVPLVYGLGKGGSPLGLLLPFLTAAMAAGAGLWFWSRGERHYQSTGS